MVAIVILQQCEKTEKDDEIWQKLFNNYNPYTTRKCINCNHKPTNGELAAFIPNFYLCRACSVLQKCYQEREKANSENLTRYTKEQKHAIYSKSLNEQFEKTDILHLYCHVLKQRNSMD